MNVDRILRGDPFAAPKNPYLEMSMMLRKVQRAAEYGNPYNALDAAELDALRRLAVNGDVVEVETEWFELAGAVVTSPAIKATKGELRKARKAARAAGLPLTGELALDGPSQFTETPKGYRARDRWARAYDALNGAPESDNDC